MFLFLAPRAEHVRRLKHSEICPYFRSYYGRNNVRIISLSIWRIYARFWKVEHISKAIWYWIAFKWTGARNGILNFNSSEFKWILEVQSRYYGRNTGRIIKIRVYFEYYLKINDKLFLSVQDWRYIVFELMWKITD